MADEDQVEKPVRHKLFRQSSLETRLYPEPDIGSSSSSSDEEVDTQLRKPHDSRPRVISLVAKSPRPDEPPPAPRRVSSLASTRYEDHKPATLSTRAEGTLDLREDEENSLYMEIDNNRQLPANTPKLTPVSKEKSTKTPDIVEYSVPKKSTTETVEYSVPKKSTESHVEYSVPKKQSTPVNTVEYSVPKSRSKREDSKPVDSTLVTAVPEIKVASSQDVEPAVNKDQSATAQASMGEATLRRVRFEADERRRSAAMSRVTSEAEPAYAVVVESAHHAVTTGGDEDYAEIGDQASANVASLNAVTSSVNMASPRPKSPRPGNVSTRGEKEESFWEKIGTLGRKKRIKEVQEVQEEGKYAIDSPGNPMAPEMPPEEYALEENEERSMISPQSMENPRLKELMFVLVEWINDELASQRIIVKDLEEDLYDGQVLHKLIETLTGERLDVPEVTQSEEGQRQKLGIVLATANRVLGLPRWSTQKWSVDSIHSKNVITILHLLVALARHFRAPVRLPERVAVQVVVVQMHNGVLSHRTVTEEITSTYDDLGLRGERDAFDTLFDHAPDKLQVVKKSLVTFVNKHLNKLGLEVTDLDTQFHDGVYLALLMGLLEGFFVPMYAFHNTPNDFDQKVHNVNLAFDLMQEVGLPRPKARPEDIVNVDLKSTLRVLYNLFTKYKGMN